MCKIITYEARNKFFRKHQNPELEINFDSKESDWANAIYFFVEEKNSDGCEYKHLPMREVVFISGFENPYTQLLRIAYPQGRILSGAHKK